MCACMCVRVHPIAEQSGAVQCQRYEHWFYSAGGLAATALDFQCRCSMYEQSAQAWSIHAPKS